jgi:hypothetical protein
MLSAQRTRFRLRRAEHERKQRAVVAHPRTLSSLGVLEDLGRLTDAHSGPRTQRMRRLDVVSS